MFHFAATDGRRTDLQEHFARLWSWQRTINYLNPPIAFELYHEHGGFFSLVGAAPLAGRAPGGALPIP
jgi:hypothetical protein